MPAQEEIRDETCFAKIYSANKTLIYNLAFKMSGNPSVAEDITQDTFLKACRHLDRFRGDSDISTWLYTIAKNSCLQYLKKEQRRKLMELERLIELHSEPYNNPVDELEKHNYLIQVKEGCLVGVVTSLSFYQRLAFILHTLFNVPLNSTAKVLVKSESATRTLVHRARRKIKAFLCDNCSLFEPKNRCKCENLINFSLKQGWIQTLRNYPLDLPHRIETELQDLKKITALYQSLPERDLPNSISAAINDKINQAKFLVLSKKKVKQTAMD
jgi:RNA polymerase sigma-70 factor (ECF subfamily)